MNEFDTRLVELLSHIVANTSFATTGQEQRAVQCLRELQEMYEQEIEQDNSTPIEDLNFSNRTWNCLKRYGVNTLEQLKNMSFNELYKVRNLGDKGRREILTFFMQEVFNK